MAVAICKPLVFVSKIYGDIAKMTLKTSSYINDF
jgi:hypothetical protein